MAKYLIIGGAGFIGSHLCGQLSSQGNAVVAVDVAAVKKPGIKSYKVNIETPKKLAHIFKKEMPDVVFHLAGPIHLRKLLGDPLFNGDLNFLARTQIILEACRQTQVKKLLFLSSGGAIYENAAQIPTTQDYPAHPASLYGLANLAIEKYMGLYAKEYHMPITVARLANAYGPGQWESGFIPAVILKILKNESPVIFGLGSQTRDYIYIDDIIQALIVLAEQGRSEIYNVGTGTEVSLHQIHNEIKSIIKTDIQPTHQTALSNETQRSALDISKMKKEFGWSPKVSLHEGLVKTIAWYGK